MKKKKFTAKAIVCALILIMATLNIPSFAKTTINISTANDLIDLAKKCKADSYSKGKTVRLSRDIDLTGSGFNSIPVFCGVFEGNNHKITGLSLKRRGSAVGIFRYIEAGGVVRNLSAEGYVKPKGSQKYAGAIAGINRGTIKNCSFKGEIKGEAYIGAIAGSNEISGKIDGCISDGKLTGKSYSGGIVGYNLGEIQNCENRGKINPTIKPATVSVQNTELDLKNIISTENTDAVTDTGGICGYSKGRIIKCTNKGAVGCVNEGYNTGGIVGRQSGYVYNCKNTGSVFGKKDVGGIVGQAEPYILLEYTTDAVSNLNSVLTQIYAILQSGNILADNDASENYENIEDSILKIISSTDKIGDEADKYANETIDNVNRLMEKLNTALADAQEVCDLLEKGMDCMDSASQISEVSASKLIRSAKKLQSASEEMRQISREAETLVSYLKNGIKFSEGQTLSEIIDYVTETNKKIKKSVSEISSSLDDICNDFASAADAAVSSAVNLNYALKEIQNATEYLSDAGKKAESILKALGENPVEFAKPSQTFKTELKNINELLQSTVDEFSALRTVYSGKKDKLSQKIDSLTVQLGIITNILNNIYSDNIGKDAEDYYIDDSKNASVYETRAKISKCVNKGKVKAEANSGGIAGLMAVEYDFNPKEDKAVSGNESLRFMYKARCVVRDCKNEKPVTAKECAGGIAGKTSLGSIVLCQNYADIKCEPGSFAGGIAGRCDGNINACAAKCTLEGRECVGGIAGQCDSITNCLALVNISKYDEYAGAVAGKGDVNKMLGNMFVCEKLGGVDDISYQSAAEETTTKNFVKLVKSRFNEDVDFKLTFTADNKTVAVVPFVYGVAIDGAAIPKVPDKKGYYGRWQKYNFDNPTYDATVKAVYSKNIQIIRSAQSRGKKAVVLLCGSFDDKSGLFTEQLKNASVNSKKATDAYRVTISNVYNNTYTVRYLPKKKNLCTVIYVKSGNQIFRASTKPVGSYLEFSVKSPYFTLYEVQDKRFVIAVAVVVVLVLALVAAIIIKRIKSKE